MRKLICLSLQKGASCILAQTAYKTLTGTFIVFIPSDPTGEIDETIWSVAAWVGIDGDTCQTAVLQTGIDLTTQYGQASYSGAVLSSSHDIYLVITCHFFHIIRMTLETTKKTCRVYCVVCGLL